MMGETTIFRPLTQRNRHDPPRSYGDCHQVCLAMVLGLDPDDVPPIYDENVIANENAVETRAEWLRGLGLSSFEAPFNGGLSIGALLDYLDTNAKGLPAIITGKSPRGEWNHDVVYFDRQIHDPNPDKTKLDGPALHPDDWARLWWVLVICPRFPVLSSIANGTKKGNDHG